MARTSVNFEKVEGTTPFADLKHYVIVTPQQGDEFVQEIASLSGNSFTVARCVFGNANAGVGQRFVIRVIATRAKLNAGPVGFTSRHRAWNGAYVEAKSGGVGDGAPDGGQFVMGAAARRR